MEDMELVCFKIISAVGEKLRVIISWQSKKLKRVTSNVQKN